jgi:hypothetical protein
MPALHRSLAPHVEPPTEKATQPDAAVTAIDVLLRTTFHEAILLSPTQSDRSAADPVNAGGGLLPGHFVVRGDLVGVDGCPLVFG